MDKGNKNLNGKGIVKTPEVRFNLKSVIDTKKTTLISAVFRYNNQRLVYSTKHKIAPKYWNEDKQRPKTHYPFYNDVKSDLEKINDAILKIHFETKENPLSIDEFKKRLEIILGRAKPIKEDGAKDFVSYFENHIKRLENAKTNAKTTIQKFRSVLGFIKSFKGVEIPFESIDIKFKDDYVNFRYNNEKSKCNSQNTLNKDIEVIKVILKKSYKDQLHKNEIFRDEEFNVSRKQTSIFALNEPELNRLIDYDFTANKDFEIVRDWFVISAWSALRWSDFSNVKPEHIIQDGEDTYLKKSTFKTDTVVHIPINKNLDALLQKYNYTSPVMTNKFFNDNLKKVCEAAGLTDSTIMTINIKGKNTEVSVRKCDIISAHDGRRTWATINYLKGYPIGLLMQVTGHSGEDTFLSYVGASSLDKARKLNELFKKSITS
jgi:integrase